MSFHIKAELQFSFKCGTKVRQIQSRALLRTLFSGTSGSGSSPAMLHHSLLNQCLREALEWCATKVEHDNASKLIPFALKARHILLPLADAKLRIQCYLTTPERFVRKPPKPPKIPTAVWINPPKQTEETQA
jgi:hypothetical protein